MWQYNIQKESVLHLILRLRGQCNSEPELSPGPSIVPPVPEASQSHDPPQQQSRHIPGPSALSPNSMGSHLNAASQQKVGQALDPSTLSPNFMGLHLDAASQQQVGHAPGSSTLSPNLTGPHMNAASQQQVEHPCPSIAFPSLVASQPDASSKQVVGNTSTLRQAQLSKFYQEYLEALNKSLRSSTDHRTGAALYSEEQIKSELSVPNDSGPNIDPMRSATGHITYFDNDGRRTYLHSNQVAIHGLTQSDRGLLEMDKIWKTQRSSKPSFRWLHIPANNMEWVVVSIFNDKSLRIHSHR